MIGSIPFSSLVKITYALTAVLCILMMFRAKHRSSLLEKKNAKLWQTLAVIFTLLTLIQVFSVIPQATQLFRTMAYDQGWYNHRGPYQSLLVAALIIIVGLTLLLIAASMRGKPFRYQMVLLQLGLLMGLLLTETISYHYTDAIFSRRLAGIRLYWLLQMASLIHIGGTALLALLEKRGANNKAVIGGVG
jgi:hypothetical protein